MLRKINTELLLSENGTFVTCQPKFRVPELVKLIPPVCINRGREKTQLQNAKSAPLHNIEQDAPGSEIEPVTLRKQLSVTAQTQRPLPDNIAQHVQGQAPHPRILAPQTLSYSKNWQSISKINQSRKNKIGQEREKTNKGQRVEKRKDI